MPQKAKQLKPFFEVGHKVQLKPRGCLSGINLKGAHATITLIQLHPDLSFFEDPQEWYRGSHWVTFWVLLDDFPGLDDAFKHMEQPLRYNELWPLVPRIGRQQLAQYCRERFLQEENEHRRDAYLQVMLYLTKGQRLIPPLSDLERHPVPQGHEIDLINRFLGTMTYLRNFSDGTRVFERYEAQAQVCEEIAQCLMPQMPVSVAHLP